MQASAYQLRIAHEALKSMIADWRSASGQLDLEGRFRQQRDLMSFVGASLAAVESAAYACYVTLTQRQPAKFSWSEVARRRGYFYSTLPKILDDVYGPGTPLSTALKAMKASSDWEEFHDLRNTFMHRTLPSRLHEGASGPGIPSNEMVKYAGTWSHRELRSTEAQMSAKLQWIADKLRSIYTGGATLQQA